MAAVGILAALHERERSGEGQLVDISMTDGSLSWLAMVVARYFCERDVPRRGELELAGGILCYFPYETKDGKWVSLGALEPKFWHNWCDGVGRPDLKEKQFEHPDSEAGRRGRRACSGSARATSGPTFAGEHDCCLEPVLDLDEALASELVRRAEMVVELDQPGHRPGQAGRLPDQAVAHAGEHRAARAGARRADATRCCARSATTRAIAELRDEGVV